MHDKKKCHNHFIRPLVDLIIPAILIIGGVFLILIFTPVWVWAIFLGLGLILSGIYILKRWR